MKLLEATKDVDCFYIYPTEYADDSENAPTFADINEKMMRETAPQTYLVLETIMLYITHRINKRNYRKNNDFTCKVAEIS